MYWEVLLAYLDSGVEGDALAEAFVSDQLHSDTFLHLRNDIQSSFLA